MTPLVSVIIPVYKKLDLLKDCVDSVLEQDYPRIELIIADDSSDDFDTLFWEKYVADHKTNNIVRFVVYSNKNNLGTVKNLNNALKLSQGEIIKAIAGDDSLFCNSFIIFYSD